jgi:DNA-directed RNA polymerase subunit M
MFCPKCKTLLYPEEGKMVCRKENCGYSGEMGEVTEKSVQKTMPTTKIECPECGNNEATYTMRQTRAADEPTTRIYRCTKCNHTWREF